MKMLLKRFAKDKDGAVTVDWVVLTAAVCGLAFAAFTSVSGGTGSVGTATGDMLSSIESGAIGE